ncbi:MAG: trypsin-like peptidase domain-containing protein, partial [Gemmatimonadota bacterium]
ACTPEGGSVVSRADAEPTAAVYADPSPAYQQVAPRELSAQLDDSRNTAIVRAANEVAPAVVSVNVIRTESVRARSVWESYFLPPNAQRQSAGFGSGVIVDPSGIIVTNDHVIQGADRISVTLSDGRDIEAELIGTDPVADIAVLRIDADGLPVARVGTTEGLVIGEWAIAIGNPLATVVGDTQPTVTAGVISAVNRNITPSSGEEGIYLGMIQTDAAINPGNSGGALVNAAGEVVGINASIISRSGGSEGLGFAIPIDRAMRIVGDLVGYGEVRRAWVGIEVEPVDADAWGRTRGVRVSTVAPGSPADEAGLEVGDRLLVANRRPLTGPLDFEGILLDMRAGDHLSVSVEGRSRSVELEAEAYPSTTAERVTVLQDIDLITVTPQIQAEQGLVSDRGAMITRLSPESASRMGLRPGDVILQINRVPIQSAEQVAQIFEELTGSGRLDLYFERNRGLNRRTLTWRR